MTEVLDSPGCTERTPENVDVAGNLSGSMANAAANRYLRPAIYGHKGTISFERGAVVVLPEALTPGSFDRRPEMQPKTYETPRTAADGHGAHTDNSFECMRTRKPPNLNAKLGYQIIVSIRLGVDAYREGKAKLFDPKPERIIEKLPARPVWEGDGQNRG